MINAIVQNPSTAIAVTEGFLVEHKLATSWPDDEAVGNTAALRIRVFDEIGARVDGVESKALLSPPVKYQL